ncbi:MAG: hypothetical protein GY906_24720 [bacterium]|nr:hypothetical protein [bacterium]
MTETKWDAFSHWEKGGYGFKWGTGDEIRFLDRVGEHRQKNRALLVSDRIHLLNQYTEGMKLRSNWGDMDPEVITSHIRNLIHHYEAMSKEKGS